MFTSNPILRVYIRNQVRRKLREEHNLSFREANERLADLTDEVIIEAMKMPEYVEACNLQHQNGVQFAIGDGKILERIVAFFQSDAGKLLIKILIGLLLA